MHILTNGRAFADEAFVSKFDRSDNVVWAVPLYADTADEHDFVVQAPGAFNETLHGLFNLGERGHRLELRYVIHKLTVNRLPAFAEFVYRNLPFVEHVALMGLEPMGYARVNRELLWIDPLEYQANLQHAVCHLNDRGIPASIYNVPLCVLNRSVWPFAKRSISDWKNIFLPECTSCSVQDQCCGFFRSAGPEWRSRGIRPVGGEP
jgi:His-Xaa-Ser system radical SAM maturase HxsC